MTPGPRDACSPLGPALPSFRAERVTVPPSGSAPGHTTFAIAQIIIGIGIGADLAIVNTYLGEAAPRRGRTRFTAVIFTTSMLGALPLVSAFLVVAAVVGQFTEHTQARELDSVSP